MSFEPNNNNFSRSPEMSGGRRNDDRGRDGGGERDSNGGEDRVEKYEGRNSDSPATPSTLTLRLIMQGKVRVIVFFSIFCNVKISRIYRQKRMIK